MKRVISAVVRDQAGKLAVLDRKTINCDDNHKGIAEFVDQAKADGAQSVLVLLEDDSVARHWTRPATEAEPAPTPAKRAAKKKVRRK
jgi:hypothetical protein